MFLQGYYTLALDKNRYEDYLKNHPFLTNMDENLIVEIISKSQIKEYKKKSALFIHGDNAEHFFIIIEGCVKLHRETPEGEESIVSLLIKDDVFGETALFGNAQYPFSAHIVEDAILLEIPALILKEKVQKDSNLRASLMRMMSDEMGHLWLENEHMALMSTPQRVGCLLLQISAHMQGKGGTFTFPYDKSLAASRLGMKAETFSRALGQLKPLGVKVNGSEVTIDDFESLVAYTCGHCSAMPGECRKADCCTYECAKKKLCSDK